MGLLSALTSIALTPESARACSCIGREPDALVADAAVIFEGMVRQIATQDDGQLAITFEVTQSWRAVETEQLVVYTAAQESACGVGFQIDRGYIVLARIDGERVRTGLCDGTTAAEDADELRHALGSGVIPIEIEDGPPDEQGADSDDAERRERRRVAPARGGCASCSAQRTDTPVFALLLGVVVAVLSLTRRRR